MINILIVEDDPMLAIIHKKFVENVDGFNIIGVIHNGKEAYEIIQNEKIDLLILDVYLPGINGFEILKKIRKKSIMTDAILVTAANEGEDIQKARAYGAFDYLVKPFEYDRLKASLQKYLKTKRLLNRKTSVNQGDIDNIFNSQTKVEIEDLPKGLHKKTLDRVVKIVDRTIEKYINVDNIALEIDISKITARRYLDYLEKIGKIEIEISHGSRGRPSYLYRIKEN